MMTSQSGKLDKISLLNFENCIVLKYDYCENKSCVIRSLTYWQFAFLILFLDTAAISFCSFQKSSIRMWCALYPLKSAIFSDNQKSRHRTEHIHGGRS